MDQKRLEIGLNELPEEVLVKIFDYLDVENLKQSSLVCKKWLEVIGQNFATMKKMKAVIDFNQKDVCSSKKFE